MKNSPICFLSLVFFLGTWNACETTQWGANNPTLTKDQIEWAQYRQDDHDWEIETTTNVGKLNNPGYIPRKRPTPPKSEEPAWYPGKPGSSGYQEFPTTTTLTRN